MNIESKRLLRLPAYMLGALRQKTHQMRRSGIDVIDLGMGNPDQRTPQHVIDKLCETAQEARNHRYAPSKGIFNLRREICRLYASRYDVMLDPETEAVSVIGTKEGIANLALAIVDEGDIALIPDPTYPIHMYSVVIAGGSVISVPLNDVETFIPSVAQIVESIRPKPKMMILSFPHNPTGAVVDLAFFEEAVQFARRHEILLVHDMAYADLTFDGVSAPSILQVPKAKEIAVEFYSLSKSHSMAGWRTGFCVGNRDIIAALAKIKSYSDYGIFLPIQVAAIMALRTEEHILKETAATYRKRRDVLIDSFARIGWEIPSPPATIFAWAEIPEPYRAEGSLKFATRLLNEAEVCVSPGVGFGTQGDGHVRIALVENENRIRQAARQIRRALKLPNDQNGNGNGKAPQ